MPKGDNSSNELSKVLKDALITATEEHNVAYILRFAFMRKYPRKIDTKALKFKDFYSHYYRFVKGIIDESKNT